MLASAYRTSSDEYAYDGVDIHYENYDQGYGQNEFVLGERICEPLGNPRGNTLLRVCSSLVIALIGGWALLHSEAIFHKLESAARTAAAIASSSRNEVATAAPPTVASTPAEPAPLLPELKLLEIAAAPGTPPPIGDSAPADHDTARTPIDEAANDNTSKQTAQPKSSTIKSDAYTNDAYKSNDPARLRAEAVGLNPDLSKSLLARLSPADYRNANVAIQTALKKTADNDTFVWPKKQSAKLARFEVSFVAGAAPDCRRYVVTITKDHWTTTALPMEKCGTKSPHEKTANRL
ncbi:hypothetical protein DLM45_13550 [Hyphomicrobium methylovorum]|uniref:hypothetical protein n=1 Tax=Hyphomicrobium methylovorum TaxID=84 RepID=UPI0015E65B46|nr:hypothetical protein [Hyphomicrobium methylovorum]MBA2127240.1 hypothetical protein [Hyphomicrobium methylovorum]